MSDHSAPPKGYSVPRHEIKAASKRCQHCQSTEHWSFECPSKVSAKKMSTAKAGAKLSPSLLLKYGIKKKPILFEPEKTDAEKFNDDMRELERQAREVEKLAQKQPAPDAGSQGTDPSVAPRVMKREDITAVKHEALSDGEEDSEERDATAP